MYLYLSHLAKPSSSLVMRTIEEVPFRNKTYLFGKKLQVEEQATFCWVLCPQTARTTTKWGKFSWQRVIQLQGWISCDIFSTWPNVHPSFVPAAWNCVVEYKCYQECNHHAHRQECIYRKIKLFINGVDWSIWCSCIRNKITWQHQNWLGLVLLEISRNG